MKCPQIVLLTALLAFTASATNKGLSLIDSLAQQAYIKASNTQGATPAHPAGDQFGFCVALAGDIMVVGAPGESSSATGVNGNQSDTSAPSAGAAYIFVRNGANWTQQAYLKASNTRAGAGFGTSVAISGDTVIVGAPYESSNAAGVNGDGSNNNSSSQAGAAYVFVRSATGWTQQAFLKASNAGAYDHFGNAVSISGDTIVVGALYEASKAAGVNGDQSDNSAFGAGAAYVFVRNNLKWTQEAYLKASNPDGLDFFGWSVAVSGDIIAIGAPWEFSSATGINGDQNDNGADNAGAAYFFGRHNRTWVQEAYVKGSNTQIGDAFGISIAASGQTVVVGAFWEDANASTIGASNPDDNAAPDSGAAYVFVRNGNLWSQEAYLKPSNTRAGEWFGASVAISGDTLVVGAPREDSAAAGVNGNQSDTSAVNSGAAYVFLRSRTFWSHEAYVKASNPGAAVAGPDIVGDSFGCSVAVSANTLAVGAFHEGSNATGINGDQNDNSAPIAGAAYVFTGLAPSLDQICPCRSSWNNHGEYVQCVQSMTAALANVGLLTDAQRRDLISQAGESDCGKKTR